MRPNEESDRVELPLYRGPVEGANCAECPFSDSGRPNKPVAGVGPEDPLLVAIGEGPGRREVEEDLPFIGPSGRMLNKALLAVGVFREEIWVTNATLCLPTPNATETQKLKAAACCAPRLKAELADMPGRPMVVLGGVAAKSLLGSKFSIRELAGSLHDVDVDGTGPRAVIPTLHPAAILRGGAGEGGAHAMDLCYWNLIYDVGKVTNLARGVDIRFREDIEIETQDPRRAANLVKRVLADAVETKHLAIDTETVPGNRGFDARIPRYAVMTAIGLATENFGVSVLWKLLDLRVRRWLYNVCADESVTKIMHNRLYDRPVLRAHGIYVLGRNDDTLLMHHNAFPGLAHDLQRVSTQFFAINPWKAEFRGGDGSDEELCVYNAKDTLATARLLRPLRHAIAGSGGDRTYEVDLKMAEIAEKMHDRGIPIDREVNRDLADRFKKVVKESEEEIHKKLLDDTVYALFLDYLALEQAKRPRKKDPADYIERYKVRLNELQTDPKFRFKTGSGEHIAAYLKALGAPLYQRTKKGRTSTQADILENLAHVSVVRSILDYREASKMWKTFVLGVAKYIDADGRIHPVWAVNKITGRWSADRPAVMNWPKADKRKNRPNLRAQIVAPRGRKLIGADFGQLEARIIAMRSGDPWLCNVFYEGKDIHSEFARQVWPNFDNLDLDQRKKLRDVVKRPEYGAFYGGEIPTLYQAVVKLHPEVQLADIVRMVKAMVAATPGVQAWHQRLIREVAETGVIKSAIYGRRRHFPIGNADVPDVLNFGVQSTAADIMATALMRLDERLPASAWLIQQIHDAVVVECDEDEAEDIAALVKECMTQDHEENGVTMHFPSDVKIGQSAAEIF